MLDETFASLADPTRRAIVERLTRQRELSVGELAEPFATSLPGVLKHIAVLEDAGLIVRTRRGRHVFCRLKPDPMAKARRWLDKNLAFWSSRLDALGNVVEKKERR